MPSASSSHDTQPHVNFHVFIRYMEKKRARFAQRHAEEVVRTAMKVLQMQFSGVRSEPHMTTYVKEDEYLQLSWFNIADSTAEMLDSMWQELAKPCNEDKQALKAALEIQNIAFRRWPPRTTPNFGVEQSSISTSSPKPSPVQKMISHAPSHPHITSSRDPVAPFMARSVSLLAAPAPISSLRTAKQLKADLPPIAPRDRRSAATQLDMPKPSDLEYIPPSSEEPKLQEKGIASSSLPDPLSTESKEDVMRKLSVGLEQAQAQMISAHIRELEIQRKLEQLDGRKRYDETLSTIELRAELHAVAKVAYSERRQRVHAEKMLEEANAEMQTPVIVPALLEMMREISMLAEAIGDGTAAAAPY